MFEDGKQVVCISAPPHGDGKWADVTNEIRPGPRVGQVLTLKYAKTAYSSLYLNFELYGPQRHFRSDFFKPCKETNIESLKLVLVTKKEKV